MTTTVFGSFEDDGSVGHIEMQGDFDGVCLLRKKKQTVIIFSDGTLLEACFGKAYLKAWRITVVHRGDLFDRIEECESDAEGTCSDQVFFRDGIKFAYFGKKLENASL